NHATSELQRCPFVRDELLGSLFRQSRLVAQRVMHERDDRRAYVANDLLGHGAVCQPVYQENVCRIQLGEKRSRSRKVIRARLRIAPRKLQVPDPKSEVWQARKNFSIVGVAARWRF